MAQHRDFTSILIDTAAGPSVTIGDTKITFKSGQPLTAVIKLLDEQTDPNALVRSQNYLRDAVHPDSTEALESIFDRITAQGLSDLVEWVAQAYTGFPTANSSDSSAS